MSRTRAQLALLILAILLGIGHAESALAAVYEVEACREEIRETLPASDWSVVGPPTRFQGKTDCAAGPIIGGPLRVGPASPGTEGGLAFSVPTPLAIVGVKYRQLVHTSASAYPSGQWAWDFESRETRSDGRTYRTGGCPGQMVDRCSESYAVISFVPKERLSALQWILMCSPSSAQNCDHSYPVDVSATSPSR